MKGQRVNQSRKITVFRGTAGVRTYREIFRILNKIPYHMHAWSLAKNALGCKYSLKTAPFNHRDLSLPTI